jgi:hypothetical protein
MINVSIGTKTVQALREDCGRYVHRRQDGNTIFITFFDQSGKRLRTEIWLEESMVSSTDHAYSGDSHCSYTIHYDKEGKWSRMLSKVYEPNGEIQCGVWIPKRTNEDQQKDNH